MGKPKPKSLPKMANTKSRSKTPQTCFSEASIEDSDDQSTQSKSLVVSKNDPNTLKITPKMANTKKMKHQSIQLADSIASNDDLLTEILLRLPVKSILRFKSVSKHWRLLLSHNHFTRRYDNLLKTPGFFARNSIYVPFDVENRDAPPFHGLDFCYDPYGIIIAKSCNGLLLCCSDSKQSHRRYYVFNPTTNQFAIIPSIKGGQPACKTIDFMCLAFPQTDSVSYKLVCVRHLNDEEDLFQIQVYSSETRKWKIAIETFDAHGRMFDQEKGVYCNGSVYWPPFRGNCLCFRIDDGQLQTLPVPEGLIPFNAYDEYFGESRGHLHLVLDEDCEENSVNVYEMLRDHSGWFVKYKVELDELQAAFPEIVNKFIYGGYDFEVVDVVRGEAEEDAFMVLNTWEKIITYKFHDKSFKQIFTLPNNFLEKYRHRFFYGGFPCFHRYTETLTSFEKAIRRVRV